jgi:sec-independent protein translocase protein TatA
MLGIGSGEILVILVVVLILFGGKKLPEFAQNLGRGIREFKRACNGEDEIIPSPPPLDPFAKESQTTTTTPTSATDSSKDLPQA